MNQAVNIKMEQQGFQLLQVLVGAPVLGKLDAGTLQLARMAFELLFEPLKQGERVGRCPGKARNDRPVGKAAHLSGVSLDDGLAHRDLTVGNDHDFVGGADRQDGRAVPARRGGIGNRQGICLLSGANGSRSDLACSRPMFNPQGTIHHQATASADKAHAALSERVLPNRPSFHSIRKSVSPADGRGGENR